MQFSAIFESWHVPDGNYPPLRIGQLVNLSFECEPRALECAEPGASVRIEHLGNAECEFCARVLRIYSEDDSTPISVLDAGSLRFYVNRSEMNGFAEGTLVRGVGTILLDHYIWVEFISKYLDAPDFFYNLRVSRIRKVQIPERFVTRHGRGKGFPTRVVPEDFGPEDAEELNTMEGSASTRSSTLSSSTTPAWKAGRLSEHSGSARSNKPLQPTSDGPKRAQLTGRERRSRLSGGR